MTRIYTKILIFFCIVCVLITTGCISQNPTSNSSGSSGMNTPVLTVVPTPTPTHPIVNSSLYITLNPVGTHHIGDVFEINGTTNLPADSVIKIHIFSQNIHTMPTGYPQTMTLAPTPAFDGIATIMKGNRGENTWSFEANISGLDANVRSFAGLSASDPSNYVINETDIGVFLPEVENLSGGVSG
jgi:hypothetical protein